MNKARSFSDSRREFNLYLIKFVCGILFLCSAATAFAQDSDEIRIETDLVPFEVTVTDKDGKPVRGLEAKDFKVFEDGVERQIDFFEPIKKTDESRP
ncbi:MAG: hypothetical protein ABWZ66_00495, partial [Pyrinomonadaceae bacterium]